MQSKLPIPTWSQHNKTWANIRLGSVNGTTIGGQGCCITCIAMANAGFDPGSTLNPAQIDDLFSTHNGYANGNLVIWNAINRLLPNMGSTGQVSCAGPAPIAQLKDRLDQGQLAILQVGFGGNPDNMHYVLALGYNGDDIVFNDPWYGDRASFLSRRYGTGNSATDILYIHYFGDAIVPVVKPEVVVASRPVELPTQVIEGVTPVNTTPTPEPVVETVPSPTPEWVGTWRPQPEKERTVVNPNGADVVDMETGQVIAHIAVDQVIHNIAGFFTYQNQEWARTEWSVDNNKWNGVKAVDLSSPTLEIPVVQKELSEMFDDTTPEKLEHSFEDLSEEAKAVVDSNWKAFWSHLSALFAILLSPILKRIGKKHGTS